MASNEPSAFTYAHAPRDRRYGVAPCPVCRTDVPVTGLANYAPHGRPGRPCRTSHRPVPLLAVVFRTGRTLVA